MILSPFFHALRSAYQAEIDDLTFDSEGKNVLRKRLADKRKQLAFLCQMMELSPEMVAVVFHQGFQFKSPAALADLVMQAPDSLPDWGTLGKAVVLQPWAHELSLQILKEPKGGWLLAVAAGLEYLHGMPSLRPAETNDTDEDDGDADQDDDDHGDHGGSDHSDEAHDDADSDESESSARRRRKAGEDWMEKQGFDRKDR